MLAWTSSKRKTYAPLMAKQMGAATAENSTADPQKFRAELPRDKAFPPPNMYLKEMEMPTQKDIRSRMHAAASFTVTRYGSTRNVH